MEKALELIDRYACIYDEKCEQQAKCHDFKNAYIYQIKATTARELRVALKQIGDAEKDLIKENSST